jgi:hypothetical protein
MVEDIHATHDQYQALGFAPSQIDKGTIHESFTMQYPSGHIITFNSDHSSSNPSRVGIQPASPETSTSL